MAVADLVVRIVTDTSKAKGLDQTATKTSKFSSAVGKASVVAGGALLGLGAAAIKAGNAAAEDAQSQALLATAMKNSTGANKDQIKSTEDWIAKMSKATGVADDDMRPALATLVRATGSTKKAQEALTASMDISAATGKDLGSVSSAVAKGYAGNTSALGRLVPGISKAATESGDMAKVMDEVKKKTGGSAAAAADTAAGKMKIMTNQMGEAEEAIGAGLLPVMSNFADILTGVAGFVQDHTKAITILVGVLATLAAVVIAVNAALKLYAAAQAIVKAATVIWTGVQWALNAALTANPIGLIVLAIVALVAIIVILWLKCEGFRKAVIKVWQVIKAGAVIAAKAVASAWKTVWKAILTVVRTVTRTIKTVVKAVVTAIKAFWQGLLEKVKSVFTSAKTVAANAWNNIKTKAQNIVTAIKSHFDNLKTKVENVFGKVKDAIEKVVGKAADLIAKLKDIKVPGAIKTALDKIKDVLDDIIGFVGDLIQKIKDIPVPHLDWPDPPGWLKKITGNALLPSTPETPATASRFAAPRVPGLGSGSAMSGAGPVTIVVNGALDPEATARQIRRILQGHDRRVGLRTA